MQDQTESYKSIKISWRIMEANVETFRIMQNPKKLYRNTTVSNRVMQDHTESYMYWYKRNR